MKWVKKIFKECFRYEISGYAMIFCIVISFLVEYYGITIYSNLYSEYMEKNEYRYQSEVYFCVPATIDWEKIALPNNCKANLKMIGNFVYCDSSNATIGTNIIMHSYQENIPLVSGRMISSNESKNGERVIILGRERVKDTFVKAGHRYYTILGEDYKVIGVIGSEKSVIFDGEIILYQTGLGEKYLKKMKENDSMSKPFSMLIESDFENAKDIYTKYISSQYNSSLEQNEAYYNSTSTPIAQEKIYCIVIYFFCFICLFIALNFWIVQRNKEMQICRICGMSNIGIILRIIKSLICICLLSMLCFFIVVFFISLLLNQIISDYNFGFSIEIVIPYIIIFVSALTLVSVGPIYRLIHYSVINAINYER